MSEQAFGKTADGKAVEQYTLKNANGVSVNILSYGGIVQKLIFPDGHGNLADVVLGFDSIGEYEKSSPYFGAIIGRVANRIASGKFSLDGTSYQVAINNNGNALHGGNVGYDKRVWLVERLPDSKDAALKLSLVDPDGTEGYPGTVHVEVVYTLTANDTLRIAYTATTDKATPINLTNHSYFNLKDDGKTSIAGHVLRLFADEYTPVNDKLIPTGKVEAVKGTPFDFTTPKAMGKDLDATPGDPKGYDQNFVIANSAIRGPAGLREAAEVFEPETGRTMEMWTTEPGVQFYTGNFLDGSVTGKDQIVYAQHSAFCLEAQHYPDSINQPAFPSIVLRPGATYRQTTEYRFGRRS